METLLVAQGQASGSGQSGKDFEPKNIDGMSSASFTLSNIAFASQRPKMLEALAWIPAQKQEPRAVRGII
jgi:hypothetical protein